MSEKNITDKKRKPEIYLHFTGNMDYSIILSVLLLTAVGYLVSRNIGTQYNNAERYLIYSVLGIFTMAVVSKIDYHAYTALAAPLYIAALIICALSINNPINGRRGFLRIGSVYIYTPALLLFAAILQLVIYISMQKGQKKLKRIYFILLLVFPSGFLLFTTSIPLFCVYIGIILILLYMKDPLLMLKYMLAPVAGIVFIIILYVINPYHSDRIDAWLNPFSDPEGLGYEAIQSIYAAASGGLFGMGIGQGTVRALLPDINYHILSMITQEIGLFGTLLILLIFFFLFFRGMTTAIRARDSLGFYLAIAVNVKLLICVSIHAGITLNLLPATSIGLPFISNTGSQMLFDYISIGILLNISRFKRTQPAGD